jgi:hypothetical protein
MLIPGFRFLFIPEEIYLNAVSVGGGLEGEWVPIIWPCSPVALD